MIPDHSSQFAANPTCWSMREGQEAASKRRFLKNKKLKIILTSLPEGVTFIGDSQDFNEEFVTLLAKERSKQLAAHPNMKVELQEYKNPSGIHKTDQFLICQFVIDIVRISVKDLIAMRKFLPFQEYRQLKNRKCARESRKKRKQQTISISEQLDIALRENKMMKEQILVLKTQLCQS